MTLPVLIREPELIEDNNELKTRVVALQEGHDRDSLGELQQLLGLDEFSEEGHRKEWNKHVQNVEMDAELNVDLLQQLRGSELQSFMASTQNIREWQIHGRSRLLVLAGHNNAAFNQGDQCWLSPVATAMVADFGRHQHRPIHAYCALSQHGNLVWDVLTVILLQLLRQNIAALRDPQHHAELRAAFGSFHRVVTNNGDRVPELKRVAVRVLACFEEFETVYIVIDRIDRCRDISKSIDHRKLLLKVLVKLVEEARCKLKIVAVVDGGTWPVENYQDELGATMDDSLILHIGDQKMTC
ncbi:MAG: hypothetical protein Q9210_001859 [Variospora velana]